MMGHPNDPTGLGHCAEVPVTPEEGDFWERMIAMHQAAASNPAYEPWVRKANAAQVLELRRARYRDQVERCDAEAESLRSLTVADLLSEHATVRARLPEITSPPQGIGDLTIYTIDLAALVEALAAQNCGVAP